MMALREFKTQAMALRARLRQPVIALETFQEVLSFLQARRNHSAEMEFRELCSSFEKALREVVNDYEYRHLRILQRVVDPVDLLNAEAWLALWLEAIHALGCASMRVEEWHYIYDKAVLRGLRTLQLERRGWQRQAAEGWTDAATICRAWLDNNAHLSTTRGFGLLSADYYFFDARAGLNKGRSELNQHPNSSSGLRKIAAIFQTALENARTAFALQTKVEGSADPRTVSQLEYLSALCQYRATLLERDFPNAFFLLDRLEVLALNTGLPGLSYFGRVDEIGKERLFLESFEALMCGDISRAADKAGELSTQCTGSTPRGKALLSRAFAIQVLGGDPDAANKLEMQIKDVAVIESSTVFLLEVCRRVVRGETRAKEAATLVLSVFPLDAEAPEGKRPEQQQSLMSLPSFYADWLDELEPTTDSIGRVRFLQWEYAANVAEYLCGLYLLKRERKQIGVTLPIPPDFRLLNLGRLHHIISDLRDALQWESKNDDMPCLLSWLQEASASPLSIDMIPRAVSNLSQCMRASSWHLFPQVVSVTGQTLLKNGRVIVDAKRFWALPASDLRFHCLGTKGLHNSEYYFLKPPFKKRAKQTYHEEREGVVTFHEASTFAVPSTPDALFLLVEGDHDEYVFTQLMDHFMPYWRAQVSLCVGGGDSLPAMWHKLREAGHNVIVVADGDKRGSWGALSPEWLIPDFEGLDPSALSDAFNRLWRESIGFVSPSKIEGILRSPTPSGSTVLKLRTHFKNTTGTFALPTDDNEIKKHLRREIARTWIEKESMPLSIVDILHAVANKGFGLKARTLS